MNTDFDDQRFDTELRRFLQLRAADTDGMRGAGETTQAISVRLSPRSDMRQRVTRPGWILVAAVLLLTLAVSAVWVGTQRRDITPPPVPPPTGLRWSQVDLRGMGGDPTVAWVGGRFLVMSNTAMFTSSDGSSWTPVATTDADRGYAAALSPSFPFALWDDRVVTWQPRSPSTSAVQVAGPGGTVESRAFEGIVDAAGIGPAGIVVATHTATDFDSLIARVLGQDWVDQLSRVEFDPGGRYINVETVDGRAAKIDAYEITRDDSQSDASGWHSPGGNAWKRIRDFPGDATAGVSAIVGTAEGFLTRDNEGMMWSSADGFDWTAVGVAIDPSTTYSADPILVPWRSGALGTDGAGRFDFWDMRGSRELTTTTEVRTLVADSKTGVGAGTLGIVVVGIDPGQVLFSPDGDRWNTAAMPDAMAAVANWSRTFTRTTVAVGEDAVVVVVWDGTEPSRPSIWRGTPAP